mmetsp:Transcript_16571/g.38282  ORF Transcript_16571/g.38282 Transcript_16571/m.38282 type:complete len:601 (-) Transcript_16571:62-1864(-)|eukprot:CAMPEP_0197184416 /NCGR_PEP_ID=MMETSP1423-20130617/9838_1 /TAXON_ID=476441 /ORGANISM="Pseudo-nitzschia heimii, Strain UNC1101" /LENGTH=600 /DNA_ID=CAMNT_0042635221 /DNA_START=464 /DNA_END=2266 /DNA_ORIENTATION=-
MNDRNLDVTNRSNQAFNTNTNGTTVHKDFIDQTLDPEIATGGHPSPRSHLLTASFNQDGGCLAIGTANGFSVHNLHPSYNLSVDRVLRGGIGQIEMLFRCNLMALVGGGADPHTAPHRVLIWDDHECKPIGELSFQQVVLRVKLRKDAIAVALRDRVYVYHLADLSLRDKIYTADNPYGLLSLSTHVQDMVLACPSVTIGYVRVELYGLRKTMLIEGHESSLRALVLTADGSKLATASHKGTIVRIWDVATSAKIYGFRRGVERANITCLAFSWDDQWVSCTSDKGTTHIFFLENEAKNKQNKSNKNRKNGGATTNNKNKNDSNGSSKSYLDSTTSLLSSGSRLLMGSLPTSATKSHPKSVCQIRGVPHPLACAFIGDSPHLIAVAGWDADGNGVLLISEFAAHQEARRVAYHVLVKNPSTADETEEQRRRRRARGWVPTGSDGNAKTNYTTGDTDDPATHFGTLRISDDMAEESHRFHTQTTEDDFCEVIVQPRKEPVIDDTPPDKSSTSSSQNPDSDPPLQEAASPSQEHNSSENGDDKQTEIEAVQDDVFVAAKETEDEIDDSNNKKDSEEKKNGKSQEAGAEKKGSSESESGDDTA